jgi:hypothetical protein
VWICGAHNYKIAINHDPLDEFIKYKKQKIFLLLEKKEFYPGNYKSVVRVHGSYFALDSNINAIRDKTIKSKSCIEDPAAIPIKQLSPELYRQYCN